MLHQYNLEDVWLVCTYILVHNIINIQYKNTQRDLERSHKDYFSWGGYCFAFNIDKKKVTMILYTVETRKDMTLYDTSVISIASMSITYKTNRAPSVWKNMPQIQPMYFHRHRDTLIQQTSEARRRHVTNAFNTYVVCQKSSCTPFIFSTEKGIYLLLQKYLRGWVRKFCHRCYNFVNRHDRLLYYTLIERATFLLYNDAKRMHERKKYIEIDALKDTWGKTNGTFS